MTTQESPWSIRPDKELKKAIEKRAKKMKLSKHAYMLRAISDDIEFKIMAELDN